MIQIILHIKTRGCEIWSLASLLYFKSECRIKININIIKIVDLLPEATSKLASEENVQDNK